MKITVVCINIAMLLFFSVTYAGNSEPVILTDESDPLTVSPGDDVTVYGSAGQNTIIVEAGAHVTCINFIGSNQIKMEETSSQLYLNSRHKICYVSFWCSCT